MPVEHDQPLFSDIADELVDFLRDAELVIHNADFDIGFINHELGRLEHLPDDIRNHCGVLDTLKLARQMHPGQRNNLDALAKRYHVDNSKRELHGALLDAQILAEVYLAMTGGQASLMLDAETQSADVAATTRSASINRAGLNLAIIRADESERIAHETFMTKIEEQTGEVPIWKATENCRPVTA